MTPNGVIFLFFSFLSVNQEVQQGYSRGGRDRVGPITDWLACHMQQGYNRDTAGVAGVTGMQ